MENFSGVVIIHIVNLHLVMMRNRDKGIWRSDMDFSEWRNRYKNRNDISSRLTHLTKGDTYVKLNMIYKIKLQVQ